MSYVRVKKNKNFLTEDNIMTTTKENAKKEKETKTPKTWLTGYIKSKDKSGGSGAKFIVKWESKKPVNQPLIEAIMISTRSGQGISFVSKGQAITD